MLFDEVPVLNRQSPAGQRTLFDLDSNRLNPVTDQSVTDMSSPMINTRYMTENVRPQPTIDSHSFLIPTQTIAEESRQVINIGSENLQCNQITSDTVPIQARRPTFYPLPLNLSNHRNPYPFAYGNLLPVPLDSSDLNLTAPLPMPVTSVHSGLSTRTPDYIRGHTNVLIPGGDCIHPISDDFRSNGIGFRPPSSTVVTSNFIAAPVPDSPVSAHDRLLDSIDVSSLPAPTPYRRYRLQNKTSASDSTSRG